MLSIMVKKDSTLKISEGDNVTYVESLHLNNQISYFLLWAYFFLLLAHNSLAFTSKYENSSSVRKFCMKSVRAGSRNDPYLNPNCFFVVTS